MLRRSLGVCCLILGLAGCASNAPDGPTQAEQAEAAKTRVSLGLTYLKIGRFDQAKSNLDKAIEFAPRYAEAHHGLAYYYQQVGEQALADEYFRSAYKLSGESPDVANSYGAFLCQSGQYDKAKEYLLEAVRHRQYSHAAQTYENLAICSQSQAQLDDAIEYLQQALKHQPARAKSLYMLTELLVAKKRWTQAKATLRQYEKVAPITPDTLIMSAKIALAQQQPKQAKAYYQLLLQMFPDYENADKIQQTLAAVPTPGQASKTKAKIKPVVKPQKVAKVLTADSSSDKIHVIEKGDNLYRLSLKYNVRMQQLIEWNNLVDASSINIGSHLYIADPNVQ